MSSQTPVAVSGIMLRKQGDDTVVEINTYDGRWIEVIRERSDGQFSHIVEPSGIRRALAVPDPKSGPPDRVYAVALVMPKGTTTLFGAGDYTTEIEGAREHAALIHKQNPECALIELVPRSGSSAPLSIAERADKIVRVAGLRDLIRKAEKAIWEASDTHACGASYHACRDIVLHVLRSDAELSGSPQTETPK